MTRNDDSNATRERKPRQYRTNRRGFLSRAGAAAGLVAVTGCLAEDDGTDAVPAFPRVEDPPEAVYVPTHREAMRVLEPLEAGEYTLASMLSYPHPFWLVDGTETVPVEPDSDLGVHMMFTVWDEATGTVIPLDSGAEIRLERDGEPVGTPRLPWTMISQEMGVHFGDNVPLESFGTYTVEVSLPPLGVERTGALAGRFTDGGRATFEFDYDEAFVEEVVGGVEYLDEAVWGRSGALEPMDHAGHGDSQHHGDDHHHDDGHNHHGDTGGHAHAHVPFSALPASGDYPGTHLLTADGAYPQSGDATFVLTVLEAGSRFADERYLLVSPRTPYNRVPLADMALDVRLERDGTTVQRGPLEQTLDDEFGLHYGRALEDVEPGDELTLTVETPPQVARHQGYETAFLRMEPIELRVPELG
ncbi:DUF7350 domain-containing protein [Natronobiforma cellulositropha]|uniref:DUF7350 domain-containing protein n=1 Tax=Natronobiforma cellulositropha TaxID=1679076 RepID=UPI0021D61185|nr:hypothetical protein [Natronobiforma cellulositropha]